MKYDAASDVFENPEKFIADRFTGENRRSAKATTVMTWGAGVHLCPGKSFAIYEIKIALALMARTFHAPQIVKAGTPNYFSPSAFADLGTDLSLVERSESERHALLRESKNIQKAKTKSVRLVDSLGHDKGRNGILLCEDGGHFFWFEGA